MSIQTGLLRFCPISMKRLYSGYITSISQTKMLRICRFCRLPVSFKHARPIPIRHHCKYLRLQTSAPTSMTGSYRGVAGRGWYVQANPAEAYWDSPKAAAADRMSVSDRGALPVVVTANGQIGDGKVNCTMSNLSNQPVKFKQITDGTSKSLLIGEYTTSTQPGQYSRSGFWANSVFGLNSGDVNLPDACRTNPLGCALTIVNNNGPSGGPGTGVTLDPDYNECAGLDVFDFPATLQAHVHRFPRRRRGN